MSITECFSMRKRRSVDKTPGRSHCEYSGKLRRTPRRLQVNNSGSFHDQSLEIIWDNNSPSPGRTLSLGKRKKHGSDSSSSGGEISELVQKLAEKSGNTPEVNPPLLAFWMARDNITEVQTRNTSPAKGSEMFKQKEKEFQTPARRPRRILRKCNKTKMKLLKQEIEMLACHMGEPDEEPSAVKETSTESSKKRESCLAPEGISRTNIRDNSHTTTKTIKASSKSRAYVQESCTNDFFESWDSDDDDLILSQVDISSLCKEGVKETQVMTNTQYLGNRNDTNANCIRQEIPLKHHSPVEIDSDLSVVSESWDFVDDLGDSGDESILQTALEDFERSQSYTCTRVPTVRRLVHLAPMLEMENRQPLSDQQTDKKSARKNMCTALRPTGKNFLFARRNLTPKGSDKPNTKFSFVPRSSLQNSTAETCGNLQAQHQKQRNILRSGEMLSVNNIEPHKETAGGYINKESCVQLRSEDISVASASSESRHKSTQPDHLQTKQVKYSKEDIERKKMEAQYRRKQKMATNLQNLV